MQADAWCGVAHIASSSYCGHRVLHLSDKGVGGHDYQGRFQLQPSAIPPNCRRSESLSLEGSVVRCICHLACPRALGTAGPVKPRRHRDLGGGLAAHPDRLPSSASPPGGPSLFHSTAGFSFLIPCTALKVTGWVEMQCKKLGP